MVMPILRPEATEHQHQTAVIDWARRSLGRYPELTWLYSIPNGGKLPYKRVVRNGKVILICPQRTLLLEEGMRPGVSDLALPVARGRFIGLWIEMKAGDNEPTPEQYLWLRDMLTLGHHADWCNSAEIAIGVIKWYLSL